MLVGLMGYALPLAMLLSVALGCARMQGSISDFYYTCMGDVFVGILCAIALFLSTYRGYEDEDRIASAIGAVLALMVAFNPTKFEGCCQACSFHTTQHPPMIGIIHLVCASSLFLDLALMSLLLFTRTDPSADMTPRKKLRNKIYKVCGWTMIASLVILAIYIIGDFDKTALGGYYITFWFETIMLFAFGTSWLVKAEVILGDKPKPDHQGVDLTGDKL